MTGYLKNMTIDNSQAWAHELSIIVIPRAIFAELRHYCTTIPRASSSHGPECWNLGGNMPTDKEPM